jgi:hypothetical protein
MKVHIISYDFNDLKLRSFTIEKISTDKIIFKPNVGDVEFYFEKLPVIHLKFIDYYETSGLEEISMIYDEIFCFASLKENTAKKMMTLIKNHLTKVK